MRHRSKAVVVVFCLLSGTATRADDWTEFRGSTGQGTSTATGLPTHWSNRENVTWTSEIPGKGWSSPILLDSRLYLTTAVPITADESGPQSLRAVCLDSVNGKIVWNIDVFQQPGGASMHSKNSHASPTPITDGKRLFVHFGSHGTAALALVDGEVLWRNEELKYSPVHGNGGSPVLVDGLVVVCCDGGDQQFVAALDQEKGTVRWRKPRSTKPKKGFSFGTPLVITVDGAKQIVSPGSDAVIAYDPVDGREIWSVSYPGGYSVVPRPVFGSGLVFVCTGYDSPMVLAIRPQGAAGDVTETHVEWQMKKGAPHNPSPLLVEDALYLVADRGLVTCLDARSGQSRWQHNLGGGFSASPVYADGKIFLQNEEGDGFVLKPGDEYNELAKNPLEEPTLASYAVGDSALFIRTERHLLRIQGK